MGKLLTRPAGIEGDARIWVVVLAGFAAPSVSFSARANIGLATPTLESEFGASRSLISLAAALGVTVMGVLSVLGGFPADRSGAPEVLAFGLALVTACLLSMRVAADLDALLAFTIVFGMADYATIPMTIGLLARHVGVNCIGAAMGLLAGGVRCDFFASHAATWRAAAQS